MLLCQVGKQKSQECNDVMIDKEGEPTKLCYHLRVCQECRDLRDKWNEQVEKSLSQS